MTAIAATEPALNGYSRQPAASTGNFNIALTSGHYVATGPILQFKAVGGSWGPVHNIFLTNKSDNSGYLTSSLALNQPATLSAGQSVSYTYAMQMQENS